MAERTPGLWEVRRMDTEHSGNVVEIHGEDPVYVAVM